MWILELLLFIALLAVIFGVTMHEAFWGLVSFIFWVAVICGIVVLVYKLLNGVVDFLDTPPAPKPTPKNNRTVATKSNNTIKHKINPSRFDDIKRVAKRPLLNAGLIILWLMFWGMMCMFIHLQLDPNRLWPLPITIMFYSIPHIFWYILYVRKNLRSEKGANNKWHKFLKINGALLISLLRAALIVAIIALIVFVLNALNRNS